MNVFFKQMEYQNIKYEVLTAYESLLVMLELAAENDDTTFSPLWNHKILPEGTVLIEDIGSDDDYCKITFFVDGVYMILAKEKKDRLIVNNICDEWKAMQL
jgi:hypothetical protein